MCVGSLLDGAVCVPSVIGVLVCTALYVSAAGH